MSTTSILSNSVRGRYLSQYIKGAKSRRVYEQFCYPISEDKEKLQRMTSINVPFLSEMSINANTISETVDIDPQILRDATASISPTSRADAIQDSEKLLLQAYTDYAAQRFEVLGNNMVDTLENLVKTQVLNGNVVMYPGSNTSRATLDAGTSSDRMSDAMFFEAGNMLKALGCPPLMDQDGIAVPDGHIAVLHPDAYYDLLSGGNVITIAEYSNGKSDIWLNGELGKLNGFRIVVSPHAKVFAGAGADNASVAATTLSSAENALTKSAVGVASGSNISSGRFLTIGTEETGSTLHPMNERVRYVSGTTSLTIVGSGPNGGLKYDHASGTAVRNADSVYPALFGGPMSCAKAYASDIGEFGEVIGPKRDGLVDQFVNLGWKWYGAYGIINENWLVRVESSSSLDA
jgi:N4-gp56 family major capsid protein